MGWGGRGCPLEGEGGSCVGHPCPARLCCRCRWSCPWTLAPSDGFPRLQPAFLVPNPLRKAHPPSSGPSPGALGCPVCSGGDPARPEPADPGPHCPWPTDAPATLAIHGLKPGRRLTGRNTQEVGLPGVPEGCPGGCAQAQRAPGPDGGRSGGWGRVLSRDGGQACGQGPALGDGHDLVASRAGWVR